MIIRPRLVLAPFLSIAALCVLMIGPASGGPPRPGLSLALTNREVELKLTGQAGATYTIETSLNLSNWITLSSGIATNGLFTVRRDAATGPSAIFYRGREGGDAAPLTVVPKADTNLSVSTLVSGDGGSTVLYGRDGVRFALSLPANSVPDASVITMTLVTNVTGLPFARGVLGAVRLEPASLAFWGAASLEITFPTNINRREVSSFFANTDGSGFQLTPDRVGTNRIVIPVSRSGLFGSSLVTTEELANAARIGTATAAAAPAGKAKEVKAHIASTLCFPDKALAAKQAQKQIDDARAVSEKQVAALLGAERQKQMANETDDSSSALSQATAIMCEFYAANIAPRWADAVDNCALAEILIQNTLSVERSRQLLGAPEDDRCPGFSAIPFCDIFKNCLEEVRLCCAIGMKGPDKVAAVYGLQRQDALMGFNCIDQEEAQKVIDLCTPNIWTGTFSMSEVGSRSSRGNVEGVPGAVFTEVDIFKDTFEGAVVDSQESGDPEIGYLVELRVVGSVTQYAFHKKQFDYTSYVERCPNGPGSGIQTGLTLNQTDRSAAGSTTYTITFYMQPERTGYFMFGALNYDPDNPKPPAGIISLISYQDEHSPCFGFTLVKNFAQTSASPFFGNRTLDDTSGVMTNPDLVSGKFTMDDATLTPARHIEFKWNFTRHPAGLNP